MCHILRGCDVFLDPRNVGSNSSINTGKIGPSTLIAKGNQAEQVEPIDIALQLKDFKNRICQMVKS